MNKQEESEQRREIEKLVVSLDNALRQKRGELKPSAVSDRIANGLVIKLRKKYGITAHSWSTQTELSDYAKILGSKGGRANKGTEAAKVRSAKANAAKKAKLGRVSVPQGPNGGERKSWNSAGNT